MLATVATAMLLYRWVRRRSGSTRRAAFVGTLLAYQ